MLATLSTPPRFEETADTIRLRAATRPLIQLLRQLASVVAGLSDAQYTQKPVGVVESSVGGHVRHCLDHVRALLSADETGGIDYDHRRRGTPVETSRCAALAEIDELVAELASLHPGSLDRVIELSVMMSGGGDAIDFRTTLGRELAYTLSHTIHHNALIGAMVKTLRGWLPDRFGYAPSTLKHLTNSGHPCAQ